MSSKRKPVDLSLVQHELVGIFDTHCHYDEHDFNADRDEVLKNIFGGSTVAYLVHAGCDITSSKAGITLAESYPNYYCTVGIHPTYISRRETLPDDYIEILRQLAQHPKVKAVGEIGLDYARDPDKTLQKRVFCEQLVLAQELDLPVVIHCREAYGDLLEILRKYPVRGECHCFSGSAETAAELVKMGFYIAFGGALTWDKAEKPKRAIKAVPLDRLLFETDAPYLAPEPFRNSRCQSELIGYVAKTASELLGVGSQRLVDITRENAKHLFGIE